MKLVTRATGEIVDVPDEQAEKLFASGLFGIPKGARLPVKTPSGTVGMVEANQAAPALAAGQHVPTEAEVAKARQEAEYGGVAGGLAAGGVGAAKGLIEMGGLPFEATALKAAPLLGLDRNVRDPLTGEMHTQFGEDRMRQTLQGLEAEHPLASFAGQAVGMGGAMALGGGAVGALGELGERGAGMIGRGALEMGAINPIQTIDEAALGDTDLAAEKVIAAVGHGVLIGGGAGTLFAALGGGARMAGKYTRQLRPADVEALAERRFGFKADGLGDLYAKAASTVSGADPEAIRALMSSPEARRIAVYESGEIQDQAARAIRTAGDDVLAADKLIAEEAKGELKAEYVRRAVRKGNEEEVTRYGAGKLQQIIDGAQEQLDAAGGYTKSIEHTAAQAYRVRDAVMSGDSARAFIALDGLKRDIQALTRNAYRGAQAIADPIDRRAALQTAKWLDGVSQDLRTGLEDESLWGKAALDQKSINAAWTKQIDASMRFHRSLTTEVGRDPTNPYLTAKGMDPSKVTGYVRNLTNPDKDLTHRAVSDYLESTRELAKAIDAAYDLPPEKLDELRRLAQASGQFEAEVKKAEKALVLSNQFRALREADSPIGGALALAGGAVGGIPGAAIGGAIGTLANPGKTVSQLAAIERLMSEVDTRIDTGISRFFSGKVPKELPASVRMLEHPDGERAAFEASVNHVREAAADPDSLASRLGKSLEPIASGAHKLAAQIATRAAMMTQALAASAPKMKTGDTLNPLTEPALYSDTQMRAWAREAAVTNDFTVALDSMARGTLTVEEVKALKRDWPKHYAVIQEKIATRLKTEKVGRSKRIVLQVMFERPVEPDLSPSSIAMFQAAHKLPPTPGEAPMGKPLRVNVSKNYATPSQSLASGGK